MLSKHVIDGAALYSDYDRQVPCELHQTSCIENVSTPPTAVLNNLQSEQ